MRPLSTIAAAILALTGGTAALAHATLVSATPAADARASNVKILSLTFSEALVEKASGIDIVMTGMPGMASHQPMTVSGFKTTLGGEGKVLTIALPRALPAGSYRVTWHVETAETHRSEGTYNFSAK